MRTLRDNACVGSPFMATLPNNRTRLMTPFMATLPNNRTRLITPFMAT
ncbi:hypothetical protein [Candidatus Pantoea formicae]